METGVTILDRIADEKIILCFGFGRKILKIILYLCNLF